MSLGKAIRVARTARKMKQRELADVAGVDDSYISYLENDKRDPTWSVIKRLCDAMQVNPTLVIALAESDADALTPYMPLVHSELWRITKKGEL